MKTYYGALSRYIFNDSYEGFLSEQNGFSIVHIASEWNKTIGSYKFVDNEDGTYNSYRVLEDGSERSLKVNQTFNQEDMENEIRVGAFKTVSGTPLPHNNCSLSDFQRFYSGLYEVG